MIAIVTDSTCDLPASELERLGVRRVPLYVNFKGKTYRDWEEIGPEEIVKGVAEGTALPTTSQPSPEDFAVVFREAAEAGADEILCLTISSELSGTYQSATLAREQVGVPVTVFDSRHASLGLGNMVKKAAELRDRDASMQEVLAAVTHIRDSNYLLFTVGTLEYLQKNGRIGGAQALLGSLLNIKPILTLEEGKVQPAGRARGTKKALREMVARAKAYAASHPGTLKVNFLHIQDPDAAETMRRELRDSGLAYEDGGVYEIGAVIAAHVGPGTFGMYMHTESPG